ncbi:hypothetical protein [Streptomyces sp. BBFR2]
MRKLLLLLVYALLVTPAGLVLRIVHDPLARRRRPGAASYWTSPA